MPTLSENSESAISVEGISKRYRLGGASSYKRLTEQLMSAFRRKNTEQSFSALQDVTFDVKRGEVVGLIGKNGAGKTTLLRILSRITTPSQGRAVINGRTGSLLEVGTGFHPELSGRENIYLNGAVLGMKRAEINSKFDEIVQFAEVEKFIDTPVKRYSSGMYLRLAFAVAAHLETEILLVDEVLAVGDMSFQKKCLGKMSSVANDGRTVIFVSHNLAAVNQLCSRALLLQQGRLIADGPASQIVQQYLCDADSADGIKHWDHETQLSSGKKVFPVKLSVLNESGATTNSIAYQESATVELVVNVPQPMTFQVCLIVLNYLGMRVFSAEAAPEPQKYDAGQHRLRARLPAPFLSPGRYQLAVALYYPNAETYFMDESALGLTIEETGSPYARYVGDAGVVVAPVEWQISPVAVLNEDIPAPTLAP